MPISSPISSSGGANLAAPSGFGFEPQIDAQLPAEEYDARLAAVRARMRERGLDTLVLVSPENIYYVTGLNHQGYFAFTALVVPLEGKLHIVARAMERATLADQVPGCIHAPFTDDCPPAPTAAEAVRSVLTPGGRLGVELTSMYFPVAVWRSFRDLLLDIEMEDSYGIVEDLRAIKSPREIELVRRAAVASDLGMQAGIAATVRGASEREVAAAIYAEMVRGGSEYPGFAPLIRSWDLLLHEHATWHDRTLNEGDALFIELSASVGRYHAPLTRMVYLGEAPPGTARAAEICLAGIEAVRAALRPGALSHDVYGAWQQVVDEALGHAQYRRHHCGYMVGIGFPPSWVGGSAVVGLRRNGTLEIREGMVFHVLSWLLGVRPADYVVSDTVLVTADGGELLTQTPSRPAVVF